MGLTPILPEGMDFFAMLLACTCLNEDDDDATAHPLPRTLQGLVELNSMTQLVRSHAALYDELVDPFVERYSQSSEPLVDAKGTPDIIHLTCLNQAMNQAVRMVASSEGIVIVGVREAQGSAGASRTGRVLLAPRQHLRRRRTSGTHPLRVLIPRRDALHWTHALLLGEWFPRGRCCSEVLHALEPVIGLLRSRRIGPLQLIRRRGHGWGNLEDSMLRGAADGRCAAPSL
mmetsp:Transcript_71138/g.112657  ORF Transcript_71138/g.112657 Transcript_71138/m.112657 type:complete len:230 (-) Transcript_71138:613-1302(-)